MQTAATATKTFNVAIVGGGITGSIAAYILSKQQQNIDLTIHLFDQGQRGVGGRSSHRVNNNNNNDKRMLMRWDHGCQFFRADTPRFKSIVDDFIKEGIVEEWKGNFVSEKSFGDDSKKCDFFGMPSLPKFFVGADGMQSITKSLINQIESAEASKLKVFTGTRVSQMERDEVPKRWRLYGSEGMAAFHDTQDKDIKDSVQRVPLGNVDGYDSIILTDVSSSFGQWHRASAGVPEHFASRVRERVGARVPLFTAMIAFDKKTDIPFDTATFCNNEKLWFAAKSNSKPGLEDLEKECWTIVSTGEYSMKKIEETPMQDPKTGAFIPQSKDYLKSVPGTDLKNAFLEEITSTKGILGDKALTSLPEVVHIGAQRWGSALRHLNNNDAASTKEIMGVDYGSGGSPLAPTKLEECNEDERTFLVDENLMLFQAGDMVSSYTPGFESSAISGIDAAEYLLKHIAEEE